MSRKPAGARKPKDPNAPKGPLSSYFIFSNERRSVLMAENKDKKITEISKMISTEWKAMSESDIDSYKQRSLQLKSEYKLKMEEYMKTNEYRSHQIKLDEWKANQKAIKNGVAIDGKSTAAKISLPRKPKDKSAPKKPSSSYFLFADTIRAKIKLENPTLKVTQIAKIIGQKWKELSDDEKTPFTKEAARLKEEHKPKIEAYAQSEDAKEFARKLAEWKEECDRRKRVYAAKQLKAREKEVALAAKAKKNAKRKGKDANTKRKQARQRFEESSDDSDSDSSSSGSSSSGSGSSSSGSYSSSDSD